LKNVLPVLFILILVCLSKQSLSANFTFGKEEKIVSVLLNEKRGYWVSLPSSYSNINNKTYPVVYLLDAEQNYLFHTFSGMLKQMAADASPLIPEVILIGITNKNRIRDVSPTQSLTQYGGKKHSALKISGGADTFIKFIQMELIPKIERDYKVSEYNILAGYSFSGLAVINALFTKPNIFDGYIAIDPSMWWDEQVMLKRTEHFLSSQKLNKTQLFISSSKRVGNVFPKENYVIELIEKIESVKKPGLNFGFRVYGLEENHQTMPILSFYNGMRFIFDGYMIDEETRFRPATELEIHFAELSEKLGVKLTLNENLVNWFAQDQMYNDQFDIDTQRGIGFLELNLKWYPDSPNAYINLGDGYKNVNDAQKALATFKNGLSFFPDNKKLKALVNNFYSN
jgi:predicted alpha/beta superfamily hydrolase